MLNARTVGFKSFFVNFFPLAFGDPVPSTTSFTPTSRVVTSAASAVPKYEGIAEKSWEVNENVVTVTSNCA